ncbi:MAG: DUF3043 domain-containing protein [Actinobacteria bacterium]|nr:DUF3043 domain-containing protein [Actinomycetota bacterium]
MGLFRPYERSASDAAEPEPTPASTENPAKPARKDAPTPSRREAEAARRERLNPTLSAKEMRVKERSAKNALRDEQFARTESAPGKVLMRDFVDSRKSISQWSMPILMVTLAVSLVISSLSTDAALAVTWFTYSLFILIAADLFMMWRKYKRLAAERLPKEPLKGLLGYMINRAINLRRLRLPAPRVKPGDTI